ncbi:MAG: D-glycero-beta-D-manno-heptose 1-phosphate adenylyltransferase [Pseudomonadota bacterium]|nr:D-glycero-beta-D-manno-heptose 1-phosphate adenylyltransferase [Pseudomonadota bacterium]
MTDILHVAAVLSGFRNATVWVAGDLMLDEYIDGGVRRISPEAPVPVVDVRDTYHRLGGAANVAHCLAALGAKVRLCGVVGADPAGDTLLAACRAVGIDVGAVGQSETWSTVRKLRVLSQHQQLLRLDWERIVPVAPEAANALIARLVGSDGSHPDARPDAPPDAIVISDYAKGFLVPETIRALIDLGNALGVPVLVDPKNVDLGVYRGATVVTPNHRELEAAVGRPVVIGGAEAGDLDAEHSGRTVLAQAGIRSMVVTLGDRGLLALPEEGGARAIQSASREVFDVTGAGDTVIAVLALCLAGGADLVTAAEIANAAAGVVVGKLGTAVVQLDELSRALRYRPTERVCSSEDLDRQLAFWRLQGKKVVFTNGCFDLLHTGHLSLLRFAASLGDVLVVGLNSDASVQRLKGAERPLTAAADRGALLAALECVDAVAVFDEDTPLRLIERVRPHVLVKGGDYEIDTVVGRAFVEATGGSVVLAPLVPDQSTTGIISRMRR